MARILIYTSPASGHTYPPVPTALELARRGHEVTVRTGGAEVEAVRRSGLRVEAVDPRIGAIEVDDWRASTSLGATRRLFGAFARRAEFELPDFEAALDDADPELLWIDINCIAASAAAEASGLPWAHYLPYPHPVPARGVPAYGPGLPPPRGPLGRLRDQALGTVNRLAFGSLLGPFNEIREGVGVAPFADGYDYYLSAPLLIQFSAEPFEYPRRWPANVRLVGPGIWDPGGEEPDWLAAEERPLVLLSASTEFQDDGALIEVGLEALADEPVAVLATTAANDPARFRPPANARVERFVPHGPLLTRASAVVCHGGMGTTQKSLAAAVPVCVVPFLRDQFEIARRVRVCDAGQGLAARRLRPDRLRHAVRATISRRAGAGRLAAAFAAAGGPGRAAGELEALLGGSGAAPRNASGPARSRSAEEGTGR
jgi:UDP:flavonoid glycosyltransferase YjiC (YdhE family)